MLDFHSIAEFSRANCIGICAFLVPANLITTLFILGFAYLRFPTLQITLFAGLASIFPLLMLLHVYSWFAIGVVMAPTYILLLLAVTCLFCNSAAIMYSKYVQVAVEDC
ncbi:hypothetical protein [Calothrix sp. 336/3]|uniref:hypothetical protein n=1 Tax=Calothrix sp. 336/3 TaxID=1337936 RepID=UPI0004E3FDFB|nr:hypothetical protein [Calothrix sp. 336/3]AKG23995.1 membrane protein [Calothrix sp. 336/3]